MTTDQCQAMEWVQRWGHHAECVLPPQHEGSHWDADGWEW